MRAVMRLIAFLLPVMLAWPVSAETYPSRTVRLIVPFGAGGPADVYARILAKYLTEETKQSFVVEDRPGAGSLIGTDAVAKSAPDGYTLLVMSNTHTTNESLIPTKPYELMRDFAPVAMINYSDLLMVVHPSVPAKTVAEFIALAKKDPGKYSAGTPPAPTINYFAAKLFNLMATVDITVVTYKGTGPLTNDLLGGHVPLGFNTIPASVSQIAAGQLRGLAVAATKRSAALPDVPTAAESGLPGFEAVQYYGLAAPAGTPRPIVERLNKELRTMLSTDDMKKRLLAEGSEPAPGSPEDYAANIKREEGKWADLIQKLGLKIE